MTIALSEQELKVVREQIKKPFGKVGAKVYVFGSRAKQTHVKFSDLDILIEPKSEQALAVLSIVSELIMESNFPYKVDFVSQEDLALSYREEVLKTRVEL